MCEECCKEYIQEVIKSPKTTYAASLIGRVYECSCVGGNLHVQLDDWNIDDEFFDEFRFDRDTSESQVQAERACFDLLQSMTVAERASALAIAKGMIK